MGVPAGDAVGRHGAEVGPTIAMFTDPAGNRVGLVKSDSM
jgi:hypothetical protein